MRLQVPLDSSFEISDSPGFRIQGVRFLWIQGVRSQDFLDSGCEISKDFFGYMSRSQIILDIRPEISGFPGFRVRDLGFLWIQGVRCSYFFPLHPFPLSALNPPWCCIYSAHISACFSNILCTIMRLNIYVFWHPAIQFCILQFCILSVSQSVHIFTADKAVALKMSNKDVFH